MDFDDIAKMINDQTDMGTRSTRIIHDYKIEDDDANNLMDILGKLKKHYNRCTTTK